MDDTLRTERVTATATGIGVTSVFFGLAAWVIHLAWGVDGAFAAVPFAVLAVGVGTLGERRARKAGDRPGLALSMSGFGIGVVALAPAVLSVLGGLLMADF